MTDTTVAALYQDIIIDHNRSPRNFREMETPRTEAEGYNPLCGDHLTVYLRRDGDRIGDISFQGTGCAISVASASLMTEALRGRTVAEAEALFARVHELLTAGAERADDLGKLGALGGVRAYPSRVKCATLAWHTAQAALRGDEKTASTE